MLDLYEVAGGTVSGKDHIRSNKNNHDAYHFESSKDMIAGVVCDGCGSGSHSEVGSKIGATLIIQQLFRQYAADEKAFGDSPIYETLRRVQRSVLSHIQVLADSMGGSFSETIKNYFLFTALGFVVTRYTSCTFAVGDGILVHDGHETKLEPGQGGFNEPDYLSYSIVNTPRQSSGIRLITQVSSGMESILVGTDGMHQLAMAAQKNIPGKAEKVGPIAQFWKTDRFFKNPYAISHRLNLINRTVSKVDYETRGVTEEHGPLTDDTTLVVIRRKR